jgi:hypothetical protein
MLNTVESTDSMSSGGSGSSVDELLMSGGT